MLSGRPILGTQLDRELFVDFDRPLDRLLASAQRGLNSLVLGSRGSGKTSLVNILARELEARSHPAIVDAGLADDAQSFLSLVLYLLERDHRVPVSPVTASLAGSLARAFKTVPVRQPASETEQLLATLEAVRQALDRYEVRVVLLIDDLHAPELAHTLFGRMRDEIWSLGCTWVVAGELESRATLLRPPADAFFETVVELPPLSPEESVELLDRRLADEQIDDVEIATIAGLGEGNPRRILELARDVVIEGMSPAQAQSRRTGLQRRAMAIGNSARRLVEDLMAHGPASASDDDLLRRLGWTRARATQVFRQLDEAGIVRASTDRSGGGTRKVYELAYGNEE